VHARRPDRAEGSLVRSGSTGSSDGFSSPHDGQETPGHDRSRPQSAQPRGARAPSPAISAGATAIHCSPPQTPQAVVSPPPPRPRSRARGPIATTALLRGRRSRTGQVVVAPERRPRQKVSSVSPAIPRGARRAPPRRTKRCRVAHDGRQTRHRPVRSSREPSDEPPALGQVLARRLPWPVRARPRKAVAPRPRALREGSRPRRARPRIRAELPRISNGRRHCFSYVAEPAMMIAVGPTALAHVR